MSNQTGVIYIATNIENNKVYVGQTTAELDKRIKQHYTYTIMYDHKFARALKKYGPESWQWKILEHNVPIEDLCNLERLHVSNFNSYKNGYNSTEGGDTSPAVYPEVREKISKANSGIKRPYMKNVNKRKLGIKLSKEHKEKISNSLTGRSHSDDTKIKMSKSQRGKIKSAEHRQNLSKSKLGKSKSKETKDKLKSNENGAKMYFITKPDGNVEVVKNLTKYCKNNGLSRGHMTEVMSGKTKCHKGYRCKRI